MNLINKTFLLWICICTFPLFAANNDSQPTQIQLDLKNASILHIIKSIEAQSDFTFVYSDDLKNVRKQIDIKLNSSIDEVLKTLSKEFSLDFQRMHRTISIRVKTSQQPTTITGVVIDEKGTPLPGVAIVMKGTTIGTATNFDGKFSLNIPKGATTLVISSIGYITQEIAITNKQYLKIILKEDVQQLDDVVVIGYNTVKKKDLTTAVAVVSTQDIQQRPVISAAQVIQGKAAGVQVVHPSGQPGTGLSIRVRGATSIQASNEPLYVVDGLPMSTISNLSSEDIESMQILKDASSAAIYGARAANGVVLITTKRGKEGGLSINFNTYTGFSKLGNKIQALNTSQYKDYISDLNKYTDAPITIPDEENRYTNWTDAFYRTGSNQNYQLSLSGGSEKLKYFVSSGFLDEQGIVKKSKFNRTNFRTNLDASPSNWLKIGVNVAYTQMKGQTVYENRSSLRAGSILSVINTPPYMQVWDSENPKQYDEFAYGSRILSPFAANAADQTYNRSRLLGSLFLNFSLSKHLNYKVSLGIDETNSRSLYYLDPISTSDGRSTKGRVEEGNSKDFEWLWENILTYQNQFANKHNLSLLGGTTLQRAKSESGNLAGYDLLDTYNLRSFSAANIIDKDATWSGASQWSLVSFLGRIAYDYESKYLLSANIRADGSSKFAPHKRWGVFPSVSVGWRISAEPFMNFANKVVSDMKLRAGYGLNGNQEGIGNYSWRAQYSAGKVPPTTLNTLPGLSLYLKTPGNRELTWEKTSQTNVGLDLSLFNNRLTLNADAYYKYTKDMLLTVYLPNYTNIPGGIVRNDAEMENKGIEFNISSKNIDQQLKWDTDFNISFNRNKVTKLGLNKVYYYATTYTTEQSAIILKEGHSLGSFYGYVAKGINPETGDVIYEDRNQNGIIDPEDRTEIGNAQPKFVFGLTNNLAYKNFALSLFFQGSYGNDIFNASKIDMTSMMDFRNQSTEVLNRWKRPGMETNVPRPGNIKNIYNSTRFVEDGSYLRLKSITLSYNLSPQLDFLKKNSIKKLQPYLTAQNLWTLTNYSGYDPEVNAYGASAVELGVDYGTYPQSKTIIFGINVEF